MTAETPVESVRKVGRGAVAPGCPAHVGTDGVWRIQDHAGARAFLRHTDTRQAGFGVENTSRLQGRMRMPVLFRDGPEHREHRRQTARFFTPRRVDTAYRELDDRDEEVVVVYHSHTATEAYPSRTDVRFASQPEAHYLLVSTRDPDDVEFRSFRIVDETVTEEEVCVLEPAAVD